MIFNLIQRVILAKLSRCTMAVIMAEIISWQPQKVESCHFPVVAIAPDRNVIIRGAVGLAGLAGPDHDIRRDGVEGSHLLPKGLNQESVVVQGVGLQNTHLRLLIVLFPAGCRAPGPSPHDRGLYLAGLVPVDHSRVSLLGGRSAVVPGPSGGETTGPGYGHGVGPGTESGHRVDTTPRGRGVGPGRGTLLVVVRVADLRHVRDGER